MNMFATVSSYQNISLCPFTIYGGWGKHLPKLYGASVIKLLKG